MLYIVATPIGNLGDITLRAIQILSEVDFVLAEDTRKTGLLLKRLGIKKRVISFFEHNEERKTSWVIDELRKEKAIALVSNAGTPTISDPGYKLIRECKKNNLAVTSLPGPSSITNALCLSSLGHERFAFLGYLPRKKGARKKLIEKVKSWDLVLVFFESPYRLTKSMEDLQDILGNRQITVAREMSKKFEELVEGSLEEVILRFNQKKPQGEAVLLIEGLKTLKSSPPNTT